MGVYLGNSIYNDSQVTLEKVEELIDENGPGVFWVTYNVTTFQELQDARDAGKIPVIKYTAQNGNIIYAPINIKGVSGYYTFSSGLSENNDYFLFRLSNTGVWSMSQPTAKDIFICEIGQTTFATAKDEYDSGKILFAKAPGVSVTVIVPMTRYNGSQFDFYGITEDSTFYKASLNAGGWSSGYVYYDDSLNASSNNAVKNSTLYAVIGNVEALLADL